MVRRLSFLLPLLFTLTAWGQSGYDEVFDANGVRPHYQQFWKIYSQLSDKEKEKFVRNSVKDFQGDNALLALPRVLTAEEGEILKKGVDQRARALQAFLKDYYSGKKDYIGQGVVPEEVVQGSLKRSREIAVENLKTSEGFNFWYGPDVIRDASGTFRVVEDNLGFIGGMGDLLLARESLTKNIPAYKDLVKQTVSPEHFYESISKRYHDLAAEKNGIPLLITYRAHQSADNEDTRVRKIFKKYGIESFTPTAKNNSRTSWLKMRSDGMYLEKKLPNGNITSQKVGHVVLDYEPHDIDVFDKNNYRRHMTELAEELLDDDQLTHSVKGQLRAYKNGATGEWDLEKVDDLLRKHLPDFNPTRDGYKGFWDLARSGKMSVTNAWGTEFVNDKGFYPYVETLIMHYLDEEPILKNIYTFPAAKFAKDGGVSLNEEAFREVQKNPEDFVIKGVTGRGGDQVYIGKKMSQADLAVVFEKVKANPNYYIFQKYTPLSVMDNHIVDIRVISDVSSKGVITADVPWGRALPVNGNGKVNLSDQGRETAIIVHKPGACPTTQEFLKDIIH